MDIPCFPANGFPAQPPPSGGSYTFVLFQTLQGTPSLGSPSPLPIRCVPHSAAALPPAGRATRGSTEDPEAEVRGCLTQAPAQQGWGPWGYSGCLFTLIPPPFVVDSPCQCRTLDKAASFQESLHQAHCGLKNFRGQLYHEMCLTSWDGGEFKVFQINTLHDFTPPLSLTGQTLRPELSLAANLLPHTSF